LITGPFKTYEYVTGETNQMRMRMRNAETQARYDQEEVKRRRQQRDLKLLIGMVHGAARFAQATDQGQWRIDKLYDLVENLETEE
jgi:hypothetical protein